MMSPKRYKVLTGNSHEAYVSSLSKVDIDLDIIDGLPGRYTQSWDTNIRPIPVGGNILTVEEALNPSHKYDCFIGHSINDLLLVKSLKIPKILLIHVSLFGYLAQESSDLTAEQVQIVLKKYMTQINGFTVATSHMKMKSWGLKGSIIPHCIDTDFFQGYRGEIAEGLRVVNQFTAKNVIINAKTHQDLEKESPIKIVGFNPDLVDSIPSTDLVDLRNYLRSYRYYVHTAHPKYEDGYNLASLEAMAVGMPVISDENPSSPIISEINGYCSGDISALHSGIDKLIKDQSYAQELGRAARQYVLDNHSADTFNQNWIKAIGRAIQKY